jgi:hypothetical protein
MHRIERKCDFQSSNKSPCRSSAEQHTGSTHVLLPVLHLCQTMLLQQILKYTYNSCMFIQLLKFLRQAMHIVSKL